MEPLRTLRISLALSMMMLLLYRTCCRTARSRPRRKPAGRGSRRAGMRPLRVHSRKGKAPPTAPNWNASSMS